MTNPGAALPPMADGGGLIAKVIGFWCASDAARVAIGANQSANVRRGAS